MDVTAGGTENFVIGVDYGTLSGRAVVVRVRDGKELGSGVFDYPHAVLSDALPADTAGDGAARLPGEWALQVPNDYRDVLRHAVPAAIADAGIDAEAVVGIATDFTACTMVPVKADGTPLNELPEFANRPHAYVKLWRHHAAQPQADRINALAAERGETWLPRYGGLISSEWESGRGSTPPSSRRTPAPSASCATGEHLRVGIVERDRAGAHQHLAGPRHAAGRTQPLTKSWSAESPRWLPNFGSHRGVLRSASCGWP